MSWSTWAANAPFVLIGAFIDPTNHFTRAAPTDPNGPK